MLECSLEMTLLAKLDSRERVTAVTQYSSLAKLVSSCVNFLVYNFDVLIESITSLKSKLRTTYKVTSSVRLEIA